MEEKKSHAYLFAWVFALLVSGLALFYKFYYVPHSVLLREIPKLGIPGSTHAHVSLIVLDGNARYDFCQPKYMIASQLVHFEDNNCIIVHKHATGVTLQTFFQSIEVQLTPDCFTTRDHPKRCNDSKNTLRAVVNGTEFPIAELTHYELRNNDHILLNYGTEEGGLLRLKYNTVPSIPVTVNEPGDDVL